MDGSTASLADAVARTLAAVNQELEKVWQDTFEVSQSLGAEPSLAQAIRRVAAYNPCSQALEQVPIVKQTVDALVQIILQRAGELQVNATSEAFASLGHCYLMLADFPNAYSAYTTALKLNSDIGDPYFWYGIGCAYQNFKYTRDAIRFFEKALPGISDEAVKTDIHLRLAIAERFEERFDRALSHFDMVLANLPPNLQEDDIKFQIAFTEQQAGRNDAESMYVSLQSRHPGNLTVLKQYAWFLSLQDDGHSLEQGDRIASSVPKDPHMMFIMARIAIKRKDLYKAYDYYRESIAHWNDSPLFWYGLGVLYMRNDQKQDAIVAFQRAISICSDFEEAWLNLAAIMEMHDVDRTSALYQSAIMKCPNSQRLKDRFTSFQAGSRFANATDAIVEVTDSKFFTQIPDKLASDWLSRPPKLPAAALIGTASPTDTQALDALFDEFIVPYSSCF